jgi:hypothetical protein
MKYKKCHLYQRQDTARSEKLSFLADSKRTCQNGRWRPKKIVFSPTGPMQASFVIPSKKTLD